jgi:hypothetical protein
MAPARRTQTGVRNSHESACLPPIWRPQAQMHINLQYFHILFDIDLKFANFNATEVKPCTKNIPVSCLSPSAPCSWATV